MVANVVGAPLFGRQAFDLIRTYLTFPMGGRALDLADAPVLAIGCVLYLVTGALLGILFHMVLAVYFKGVSSGRRFAIATAMGVGLLTHLAFAWTMAAGENWGHFERLRHEPQRSDIPEGGVRRDGR